MGATNIPGGAVIWARQTIESEIFFYKPDKWFKIWFFITCKVNHKDNKLFKRGTNLITYRDIIDKTKATKNQIDKFIRWAKEQQMLTTTKTTRGMVVTICNYEYYQDFENYRDDNKVESRTKRGRNADDTINNNGNNEKKKDIVQDPLTIAFQKQVNEEFPTVAKLPKQITDKQFKRIKEKYGKTEILKTLRDMENKKDLIKKYNSVGLTLEKWLEISYGQ